MQAQTLQHGQFIAGEWSESASGTFPVLSPSTGQHICDVSSGGPKDIDHAVTATIWTRDVSHAHRPAGQVRAGSVSVNGWAAVDPGLPWGGMKTSGVGRELGWAGSVENTEEKTVTIVL